MWQSALYCVNEPLDGSVSLGSAMNWWHVTLRRLVQDCRTENRKWVKTTNLTFSTLKDRKLNLSSLFSLFGEVMCLITLLFILHCCIWSAQITFFSSDANKCCGTYVPGVAAAEALGAEHRADDAGEGGTAQQHRLQENSEFGQTGGDEEEGDCLSDFLFNFFLKKNSGSHITELNSDVLVSLSWQICSRWWWRTERSKSCCSPWRWRRRLQLG